MQLRSDEAAAKFEEVFNTYSDAIFRHISFHYWDRERGKELTQETFVKTWEYLAKGNDIDNIQAFLYRVATNLVYSEGRKKHEQSLDVLLEAGFDPGEDDSKHKRDVVAEEAALKALSKVDEKYRQMLTLHFVEGLPPGEIAEIMDIRPNTASVWLHRGIKQLRSHMDIHE